LVVVTPSLSINQVLGLKEKDVIFWLEYCQVIVIIVIQRFKKEQDYLVHKSKKSGLTGEEKLKKEEIMVIEGE
jgi:hypothetical protein